MNNGSSVLNKPMCTILNNVLTGRLSLQDSDGEKSDDNLVVDVSNEVGILLIFF